MLEVVWTTEVKHSSIQKDHPTLVGPPKDKALFPGPPKDKALIAGPPKDKALIAGPQKDKAPIASQYPIVGSPHVAETRPSSSTWDTKKFTPASLQTFSSGDRSGI
ncbi:hypothetical protein F2Q69_00026296 [Brassica cretica]|uniref:Uncharacterized protein n=1 Tax=Brassica cretica TaxID=69181 RepID=A0A8S9RYL2_BRACR|nr:hypothetical protein F2Q69_00026296 [Brassica cretica]